MHGAQFQIVISHRISSPDLQGQICRAQQSASPPFALYIYVYTPSRDNVRQIFSCHPLYCLVPPPFLPILALAFHFYHVTHEISAIIQKQPSYFICTIRVFGHNVRSRCFVDGRIWGCEGWALLWDQTSKLDLVRKKRKYLIGNHLQTFQTIHFIFYWFWIFEKYFFFFNLVSFENFQPLSLLLVRKTYIFLKIFQIYRCRIHCT